MIRLVIAGDQAVVHARLSVILGAEEDIEVVGEVADDAEAIALAHELCPDVVCMGVRMSGTDGIVATRAAISDPDLDVDVLILTTFGIDDDVLAFLEIGAAGFLLKGANEGTLLGAVRSVAAEERALDRRVTRRILRKLSRRSSRGTLAEADTRAQHRYTDRTADAGGASGHVSCAGPVPMDVASTPRELEMLRLLAQGISNSEVAARPYVEPMTVKYHLTGLMQKTGSRDRLQTVLWGIRTGLIRP